LRIVRPIREGPVPVERAAEGGGQVLARERKVELHAGRARPCFAQPGRVGHLVNRRDAGNRFLRERTERVRHGANQSAVDVDRAAAHAGDDAGVRERPAFELGQDQVPVRADYIFEYADDVRLELLDVGAVEDGPADADHAGPDLVDPHLGGGSRRQRRHADQDREQGKREAADGHGYDPIYGRSACWSRRNGHSC
jgi:hypothetical protein